MDFRSHLILGPCHLSHFFGPEVRLWPFWFEWEGKCTKPHMVCMEYSLVDLNVCMEKPILNFDILSYMPQASAFEEPEGDYYSYSLQDLPGWQKLRLNEAVASKVSRLPQDSKTSSYRPWRRFSLDEIPATDNVLIFCWVPVDSSFQVSAIDRRYYISRHTIEPQAPRCNRIEDNK